MARDEGGLSALQTAILAGVLLVVVVGADAALNRTVSLEVETEDGWHTLATLPPDRASYAPQGTLVEANRSDDLAFRVVVDNHRLDGFQGTYEVRHQTDRVAEGSLDADALGSDEARFTVPGDELLGETGSGGDAPTRPVAGADLVLLVDGQTTRGWLEIQEVAR